MKQNKFIQNPIWVENDMVWQKLERTAYIFQFPFHKAT